MGNDARERTRDYLKGHDTAAHRQCDGKVAYPSKKNAAARARCIALNDGRLWMAYKCRRCRKWHIGKSRPWLDRPDVSDVA